MESYTAIEERARPVWEKVISLIGYFDLDPNRALDIILDVLSVHLAMHYTFFLSLLSFSPWSGAYQRAIHDEDGITIDGTATPSLYKGKSLDEVLAIAQSRAGGGHSTLRPQITNPSILAQVLGFKFGHYNASHNNYIPFILLLIPSLSHRRPLKAFPKICTSPQPSSFVKVLSPWKIYIPMFVCLT